MSDDSKVEQRRIETEDGVDLEAEFAIPAGGAAPETAMVVCHPHPQYGGSMHANVVDALFRALPSDGVAVVRFNFRGTGSSTGTHDGGNAERLDASAALAAAIDRWPSARVTLAGYSFGADIALAVDHPSLVGWFVVAPPLRLVPTADMPALVDERPKTFVAGSDDQFHPYQDLVLAVADVPSSTVIEANGADHFFATGLDVVVETARRALDESLGRQN